MGRNSDDPLPRGRLSRLRARPWLIGVIAGASVVLASACVALAVPGIRSTLFSESDQAPASAPASLPAESDEDPAPVPSDLFPFDPKPSSPAPAETRSVPPSSPQLEPPEAPRAEQRDVPVCPSGEVSIIYAGVHQDATVWTAGVIRNDSDTPVQVIGTPGAWGADAAGRNIIPVGGYFQGHTDELLPGDFAEFQVTSAPVTPEELSAVVEWKYQGGGTYLSAHWYTTPDCSTKAPIVVHIMP